MSIPTVRNSTRFRNLHVFSLFFLPIHVSIFISIQGPDPDIDYIAQKLQNVKHKILILSGKGGVGKSTLTAMLARALAASNENLNIGVLDIDLCGPSAPRLFGVVNEQVL